MEFIAVTISLLLFAITMVVGGVCFFRGLFFLLKALSNTDKNVTGQNEVTLLNFYNALWLPGALTQIGKLYRNKALKNFGIFFVLLTLNFLVSYIAGFNASGT